MATRIPNQVVDLDYILIFQNVQTIHPTYYTWVHVVVKIGTTCHTVGCSQFITNYDIQNRHVFGSEIQNHMAFDCKTVLYLHVLVT